MQSSNRILDDLARVANGAVSTLAGAKDEIDALIRQKIESCLVDADLVPKEDFEVVKLMAAEARLEQERLSKRVGALEKRKQIVTNYYGKQLLRKSSKGELHREIGLKTSQN